MCFVSGNFIQYTHKGCIYPTVASGPVAVLAVRLLVRRIEILIAPPQTFFLIEHTGFIVLTACIIVHIPHFIIVLLFSGHLTEFGINGHCHLDSIDPPPVVNLRSVYYHIDAGFDIPDHVRVRWTHII